MTRRLRKFTDEFAALAEDADDQAQRDAFAVLEALARGERPTVDVARRIRDRAEDGK